MMDTDMQTLNDEAAAWVARMDKGEWSSEDEERLEQWLAGDIERSGALLRMQASWMAVDRAMFVDEEADEPKPPKPLFYRRGVLAGAAASLAASGLGGVLWIRSTVKYETELGEIRQIPLADGSVAAINTKSAIEVKMEKNSRKVRIDTGEAWFQVEKDVKRPFIVEAGSVQVRAVGTAFSVRKREDGADILVTEGVVEAWLDDVEDSKIRLAAGQSAFMASSTGSAILAGASGKAERTLAWRDGKIDLAGISLFNAVAEFNRYNKRQIVIMDPTISNELFDGVFQVNDPEGFSMAIKSSLGVPVDFSRPLQIRIGNSGT